MLSRGGGAAVLGAEPLTAVAFSVVVCRFKDDVKLMEKIEKLQRLREKKSKKDMFEVRSGCYLPPPPPPLTRAVSSALQWPGCSHW